MNRCEMYSYCKYARNNECKADDILIKKCPYLSAIGEIALLSIIDDDVEIGDWEWWK